jgi:C4-dicarboxylate-specific signal transduction histidine kinase
MRRVRDACARTGCAKRRCVVEDQFEPFFTTGKHGLGMGLFVASHIADLQNIELSLDAVAATGATFRVGLPLA